MVRSILSLLLIISALSALVCSSSLMVHASDETDVRMAEAEKSVSQAYLNVSDAERAGANVSSLVTILDQASACLAEANQALRAGNRSGALDLADDCIAQVNDVVGQAAGLKSQAEEARTSQLYWVVGLSSVGLGLLFIFGLAGWRILKRRYVKRLLGMRPQRKGVT
jgi:DNA-binding PucR family transcriptional regulator